MKAVYDCDVVVVVSCAIMCHRAVSELQRASVDQGGVFDAGVSELFHKRRQIFECAFQAQKDVC